MNVLRRLVKRAGNTIGIEITRPGTAQKLAALTANFRWLLDAYEVALNQQPHAPRLEPDELRTEIMGRLLGTPPPEAYFVVQALAMTSRVPGDVCEFGVAQGETSALIANEIRSTSKVLHLFDSFAGLPAPTAEDQLKDDIAHLGSMAAYQGSMNFPEDLVIARLGAIGFLRARVQIHKGFVEESTFRDRSGVPSEVSFAYVDFDFFEPIRVTLDYLHTVTASGAIMIVDDYDFFSTGAKKAVDEFAAAHAGAWRLDVPSVRLGHFAVLTKR
jgi:O-methyltransferase